MADLPSDWGTLDESLVTPGNYLPSDWGTLDEALSDPPSGPLGPSDWGTLNETLDSGLPRAPSDWGTLNTQIGPQVSASEWGTLDVTIGVAGEGQVAIPLELSVEVQGDNSSGEGIGTADIKVTVAVLPGGSRPSQGTAEFGVAAALTASNTPVGGANLGISVRITATGSSPSSAVGQVSFSGRASLRAVGSSATALIPVRVRTPEEILSGNRLTRYWVDVLDPNDNPVSRLEGVTGGYLEWIANAMVKGGGSISLRDKGETQGINWLTARLRPTMSIVGLPDQPLGIYLVSEMPESWGIGRSLSIKVLDKTTILDQDTVAETFALPSGAVITDEVVAIIESVGITNHAVTPSTATLPGGLVWTVGTSKLRIINDLLSIVNYFSLYMNFEGQLVAEPYTLPAARPLAYEFIDGNKSIYDPNFIKDVDLWSIPNRVTVTTMGGGAEPVLTSTIDNTNPLSPYSIPSRGRVIGHVEEGVEIADQPTLDAYARRRLIELTSPTSSVQIKHAPVPGLAVNNVVRFRRVPAGVDNRHVVTKTKLELRGSALATSTFREVVDL